MVACVRCVAFHMMHQMFEGSIESAKEHKPPRVMPQLMEYFKAIKVRELPPSKSGERV